MTSSAYRSEEGAFKQYPAWKSELDWTYSKKKLPCHYVIDGHMVKVKGVERSMQLIDDLINRKRFWNLKKEAEDKLKMKATVYQSKVWKKYKSHKSI
jgi:hypothetical protein